MSEFRWTTKDGRELRLSEMTDKHLRNTINYLRNKASNEENAYWRVGCMLSGEMATYAWENALDDVVESGDDNRMIADLMENELRQRGNVI